MDTQYVSSITMDETRESICEILHFGGGGFRHMHSFPIEMFVRLQCPFASGDEILPRLNRFYFRNDKESFPDVC